MNLNMGELLGAYQGQLPNNAIVIGWQGSGKTKTHEVILCYPDLAVFHHNKIRFLEAMR